jgi:hypothetical protein
MARIAKKVTMLGQIDILAKAVLKRMLKVQKPESIKSQTDPLGQQDKTVNAVISIRIMKEL